MPTATEHPSDREISFYGTVSNSVLATALRTVSVSFEDGVRQVTPSEQTADLLRTAAGRLESASHD